MVEFRLRAAQAPDSAAIKALIHETGINPTGLDWRRFVMAELADGQFCGCGQIKPHSDGSFELASIAVSAAQRGQGCARLIIEHLLQSAPRPLYLTCRAQLGSFYQQFGFQSLGGVGLPPYFRRISRLAGLMKSLHLIHDKLLVMVLR